MKKDNFEEILKRKFEGHSMTPPPSLMFDIESQLASAKNITPSLQPKRVTRFIWGSVAAAASLLAAVMLFNIGGGVDDRVLAEVDSKIRERVDIIEGGRDIVANNPTELVAQSAIVPSAIREIREVRAESLPTETNDRLESVPLISEVQVPEKIVLTAEEPKQNHQTARSSKPSNVKSTKPTNHTKPTKNPYANTIKKQSRKSQSGLFAHVSSNSIASGSPSVNNVSTLSEASSFVLNEVVYGSEGTRSDMTTPEKLDHDRPISIGAHVGFNITDRLSVESGLVYSQLHSESEMSGQNGDQYKMEQDLQYLGIPVALRYKFLDHKVGNIYAKGGVMIERILSAKRSSDTSGGMTTEHFAVSGVQPSVNFSLGGELKILSKLGLYIEPGLNYYFDCRQPDNFRTYNPLSFNLSMGLRFLIN